MPLVFCSELSINTGTWQFVRMQPWHVSPRKSAYLDRNVLDIDLVLLEDA